VRSFLRSWCWLAFLVAACSTPPVASSTDTSKVILFQDATGGGDSKVGDADATPGKDAQPGDIDSHDGAIDSQVDAQDSGATEDVSQPADSSTDPDVGTDTSESDVPKLGCNTPGAAPPTTATPRSASTFPSPVAAPAMPSARGSTRAGKRNAWAGRASRRRCLVAATAARAAIP
jgi:hypothetical protein